MKASRFLVFLVSLLCMSDLAYAQSTQCVNSYFAARKANRALGISAPDAEQLVSAVAQSIGLSRSVTVVPCTFIEKAYAWPGDEEVPEGEYILYNPTWVREVLGTDKVQAVALFGHELGHFLNGDFTIRKEVPRQQRELDADHFAGCAVARMPGDLSRLQDLFSRLRLKTGSVDYPDQLKSIDRAKEGFSACGGAAIKLCRLPEHGVERWGFETTISRSSNWRGGGGSQPGYCAELGAQLRQEHPDAQEFETRTSSEDIRDTCQPFRCIQYQYTCTVAIRGRPVFREMESKNCPEAILKP